MMTTSEDPALVFMYLGYYCSIYSSDEYWWYEITTEDMLVELERAIDKERVGIGELMEYLIDKINNLMLRDMTYLN
jgi:hypothetical protein